MKTYQEKTNADNKSIGFDYQYYYFLYQLLTLEEGQKIGLEVQDDVHLELNNGTQTLLQLKHSIQTSAAGEIINLTERDTDLWKTIYNWVNIINDPADGRGKGENQLQFIDKTNFILVSNKASNLNNTFLKKIEAFKKGNININDFKQYLQDLHSRTEDKKVKDYIGILKKQTNKWLSQFLLKLEFELDSDDLITKIKSKLKGKQIKESKIEDVFNAVDSNLRKKNYIDTKSRLKIIISFEDFYRDFNVYFDKGRNNKLPINKRTIQFDKPLEEQLFIKQLIEIYALKITDKANMIMLSSYMMQLNNHLDDWVKRGLIVQEQLEEFNKECIIKWSNTFDEVYREINLDIAMFSKVPAERDIILAALKCLDEIRKKELIIDDTELDTELSNGQFYLLSNAPIIGWRIDWEGKYKDECN